ncbi:MAG TPA: ATP-binding protein [Chitinophagales bacterium]|nr:ATP-binding protein [Chitinophagales bacterium]
MFSAFTHIWNLISRTGIRFAQTDRDRREIIDLNRGLFVLLVIQCCSLAMHLINGLQRSAAMTLIFVIGLLLIRILVWRGQVNTAKISSIVLINYNTISMAVFLGVHTHIIDFLLLTALLPLYFFEIKNRKLIFWGISISVIPFIIYHFASPYIASYGVSIAEQLVVNESTEPVKICSLVALLYLIYHKNSRYEKDVLGKEQELINQKELYERLLEQIPIDIVTFDKELRYSYINSKAIADPEMKKWMIGKTNADYFEKRGLDPAAAIERDRILHQALFRETAIQMEEILTDRHGKSKHSVKGAAPIYNQNKDLLCLVGYSLDITDMKDAEIKLKKYAGELEKKNDDLKHFIHATSHDLKSPLRNIASYLQLLQKRNASKLDDDSIGMIGHTIKSVKQLNQLINDIYQYSMADQNDKPTEITDLNKVVEDVIRKIGDVIAGKKALVHYDHLPVIEAAPSHMSMVLSNLIENGLKYNTSANPAIKITFNQTAEEYIIGVNDNGIGIEQRHTRQIFEIFKRLHTSEEYDGTGVGLAICNKIVQNYGGRMWVESEPGIGSTFFFSLSISAVRPVSASAFKIDIFDDLAKAS